MPAHTKGTSKVTCCVDVCERMCIVVGFSCFGLGRHYTLIDIMLYIKKSIHESILQSVNARTHICECAHTRPSSRMNAFIVIFLIALACFRLQFFVFTAMILVFAFAASLLRRRRERLEIQRKTPWTLSMCAVLL